MSSIFHSSNELRALILEHPELPIVFCCGNRDTAEAFTAKNMVWRVGEVLDTAGPYLIIEYYAGARDINTWLERASVNVTVDYDELEYSEVAPYQIMFTGDYLKL